MERINPSRFIIKRGDIYVRYYSVSNSSIKLYKDIKRAEQDQNYDLMYEYIVQYERQFELTEEIAMMKCRMLYETGSFLELREETIVLLKTGIQQYDALMIYYVKSLIGLGQYFEGRSNSSNY